MTRPSDVQWGKVPEVTLWFWIVKIAATTLGETGGDAVTMSMNLGYLVGTAIFVALFIVAVAAQISARRYRPFLFWAGRRSPTCSTGRSASATSEEPASCWPRCS